MKKIFFFCFVIGILFWLNSCQEEKNLNLNDPKLGDNVEVFQNNPTPTGTIPEATVQLVTPIIDPVILPASPPALPELTPENLTATLQPGNSIAENKNLFLPASVTPPKADILVCFDLTGSMGGELNNVKVDAQNIINSVRTVVTDSRFGVISHMDYNGSFSGCGYSNTYGGGSDYPYNLDQALTFNNTDVVNAINGLTLGGGVDGPEDYSRAFYESYSDAGIGFRSGAKKIVLAFLDAVPHDCAYNSILGGSTTSGPDPGRDAIVGTSDDLAIISVLDGMLANNVTLIPIYSGGSSLFNLWNAYALRTGGKAFQINPDGTIPGGIDIPTYITSIISGSITRFNLVSLQTCDPAYSAWLTSPTTYTNVELGEARNLPFAITITVPSGTADGLYCFDVCAVGDGVQLDSQHVCITVVSTIDVPFDIHPTSCPNPINVSSRGVTPAAILGTSTFDVSKIDPSTIRLEDLPPIRWGLSDVSTPFTPFIGKLNCFTDCNTYGPDGILDLTLKFDTRRLASVISTVLTRECIVLKLTGNLKPEFGGTPIRGEDVVIIIRK